MDDRMTRLMDELERDPDAWQAVHPRATFAELETAVEGRVAQLRARLLEQRVERSYREEHPACPACGTTMVPRSRATREVVMQGDETVHLERSYVRCPSCGTGIFPPG
jgi:YgiT-type zinc finger domain-containing protein